MLRKDRKGLSNRTSREPRIPPDEPENWEAINRLASLR